MMVRALMVCALLAGWTGHVFGQAGGSEALVRLDCREGVGLIPSIWRGLAEIGGEIPGGLTPRTVALNPALVQAAWDSKLNGGAYAWEGLDAALDTLAARGMEVVLPLPVPAGDALADLWPELVFDTADRTAKRVSRFEISAHGLINGSYLQYYEAAVWAVYRADSGARIGGPGAAWEPDGFAAFLKRCSRLNLPLDFLSWRFPEARGKDLNRSVEAARALRKEYRFETPPALLISGWYAEPDSGMSTAAGTLSALLPVLDSEAEAVCLDASRQDGGLLALRALERMGRIRVAMTVEPAESGVAGMGSLDGEDVIALFWRESGTEPVFARASFSGLAWGRRVRVQRFLLDGNGAGADPVEERALPVQEPFRISFPLPAGGLTLVRLQVEN